MSILDRYLFRLVSASIFAVLLAIVGIDALAELIDQMADMQADYGMLDVFFYILLKLPTSLTEYAGYSALIGVMIGLGLLSNTGELTVIRASGFSLIRIARMVLQPALILIVSASLLAEFVVPVLEHKAENERSLLRQENQRAIEEDGLWMFDKGTFIHVNSVYPDGRLLGLSRYKIDLESAYLETRQAEESLFDDELQIWVDSDLRWTDASSENIDAGEKVSAPWQTALRPELLNLSAMKAEQMSARDLSKYSQYLGEDQARAREYQVQFWKKILAPFAIISLVFVGMSFVLGSNRQVAIGERIFVGVMVGTVFQLLQEIFGPASVVWGFPAFWAVTVPILITLATGALLIKLST